MAAHLSLERGPESDVEHAEVLLKPRPGCGREPLLELAERIFESLAKQRQVRAIFWRRLAKLGAAHVHVPDRTDPQPLVRFVQRAKLAGVSAERTGPSVVE